MCFVSYSILANEESTILNKSEVLTEFFGRELGDKLEGNNVAGASIVVVKDGEVIFEQGYGYSNFVTKKLVSTNDTLFRVASVSKLFTWTAIMQLVEQEKINLEDNVNDHLKEFQIPDTFNAPIKIKHLITHTAGFNDQMMGLIFLKEHKDQLPLAQAMKKLLPARIRPPGEFAAYSNYGTALAGLIVQNATNKPFSQYVNEYIFKPLKMVNSSFEEPLPPKLALKTSLGYSYEGEQYIPGYFEFSNVVPAGSLTTSSSDIANFMIAHLQHGQYENTRIFNSETAYLMQQNAFTHHPRMNGLTYGFHEKTINGIDTIYHDGDSNFFHSFLSLSPNTKSGIFVVVNSDEGDDLVDQVIEKYYQTFFENSSKNNIAENTSITIDVDKYIGTYRLSRFSISSIEKVLGLLFQIEISANENGELEFSSLGNSKVLLAIEKDLFISEIEHNKYAFSQLENEKYQHFFIENNPASAFDRIDWYETRLVHLSIYLIVLLIALISFIYWFFHGIKCFKNKVPLNPLITLNGIQSMMVIGFVSLFLFSIIMKSNEFFHSPHVTFYLAMICVITLMPLLFVKCYQLYMLLGTKETHEKIKCATLILLDFTFLLSLNYWNLIGFKL